MSNLELKILSFVNNLMVKNNSFEKDFISLLETYGDQVIENVQAFVRKANFPYDLAYLTYDVLDEAKRLTINAKQLLLTINVAIGMFRHRKKIEPVVIPVWTGPHFDESPIVHQTFDTVQHLFQTAKYEILIVGYTFSLESELIKSLFHDVIDAARRGCRIEIIYHQNEQNVEQILKSWPDNLFKPSLYYWKGNEINDWSSLHSKLIMIDQQKMLITSANFTFHGFQRNIETGLMVENQELAQIMWRQFRSLIKNNAMVKYQ